ncbi:MAG: cyclopropane fatty acyl phospholipid synthase [Deltaproteobacteria bacterium]|nr:cyclopropane fatty acyl phospholipid synthase [Deltaproteobacteria bacterium]
MSEPVLRQRIERLLAPADVVIDGSRPWDLQVKNSHLFRRVLLQGSLGFGESYMDGWWDSPSPDQLLTRIIRANVDQQFKSLVVCYDALKARVMNCQSRHRSFSVGERHYNIGNDLYRRMLDSRMIYSCGYWRKARDLEQAQLHKLELSCRKLDLQPGQRVLDIGCGWGGTSRFMAETYGVDVVGVTISGAQAELARETCRGLPVEIRLQDYRDIDGLFDRVISIGMFEHVGYKNYGRFFSKVAALLKDDGLFLLHTIGHNISNTKTDPWIDRYIFPNGVLPSAKQITSAYEKKFVLEDWHSFGADYDLTLMAWRENFNAAWPELRKTYDERFRRMWNYYLNCSAASFRARDNQLWQLVLSKQGIPGGRHFPR